MQRHDLATTDSTSTHAAGLLRDGAHRPVLVTAREQTAGRGRHGRAWHSPVGGAWFTLGWPTTASPDTLAPAPLVVGLAIRETLIHAHAIAPTRLRLKWPNDLLLDGRKVAGILCEQHVRHDAAPRPLLVGVGINANLAPQALGDQLRQPATTLRAALGHDVDLDALIDACAANIARHLSALEAGGLTDDVLAQLNAVLAWRHERVTLERAGTAITGILHRLDAHGRAVIGDHACDAGEISVVRRG
jgi:BirA family transcriptional regulator, biotin operon repressor / biotin---[acetyl-CoA-carboxylase] ligase